MKEQHKIWQNEWRQIMEKPINVEVEPDCDFDLHFDIWDLEKNDFFKLFESCLLYTSPSPRDLSTSRMPSSA